MVPGKKRGATILMLEMVRSVQPITEVFISLSDMDERPSEQGYEPSEDVVSLCDMILANSAENLHI
jgi:hypothetical protein